jgi:hypothetical protein
VLDLLQHFFHIVEEEDDTGRKTGERSLLFPRYHQLDAVRRKGPNFDRKSSKFLLANFNFTLAPAGLIF